MRCLTAALLLLRPWLFLFLLLLVVECLCWEQPQHVEAAAQRLQNIDINVAEAWLEQTAVDTHIAESQ